MVVADLRRGERTAGTPRATSRRSRTFSLQDAEHLAVLMPDAALADVGVRDVAVPLRSVSFEDWWSRTSALAGPLAQILATLPEPAIAAPLSDLRERTAPDRTAAGREFSGVSLLATGRVAG